MPTTAERAETAALTVRHNTEARSYDAILDDKVVGMIVYERSAGRVVLTHTLVEPAFRNMGIGTMLTRAALDDLRAEGAVVTNLCSFVRSFVDTHPEYRSVVDGRCPRAAVK